MSFKNKKNKRYPRSSGNPWLIVFGVIIFLALPLFSLQQAKKQNPSKTLGSLGQADSPQVFVRKVVDGDSLELASGQRVRLIGIDAPESSENPKAQRDSLRSGQALQAIVSLGQESKRFVKNLIEGKKVRLEVDAQQHDKYGRLLAYLFLDDMFINAEIVRQGYASLMTIPPNVKYNKELIRSFEEARSFQRGLWEQPAMAGLAGHEEPKIGLDW